MPLVNVASLTSVDSNELSSPAIRQKSHLANQGRNVPAFPLATARPELPPAMRDELVDFYAFIFCQGGFRHLGMTFEQFLLVVATVNPGRLRPTYDHSGDHFPHQHKGSR
jgi:hypothetical protein